MPETPPIYRRRNIRLRGYDYSLSAAYFFTIVTGNRLCIFGHIDSGDMRLNSTGEMIHRNWLAIPERFPSVILDEFVVMPNHVHGIIVINNPTSPSLKSVSLPPVEPSRLDVDGSPTLGEIIGAFKSLTTRQYGREMDSGRGPSFQGRIWQRNYYDRIIRNERELDLTRRYISENPLKWHFDRESPNNPRQPHPSPSATHP